MATKHGYFGTPEYQAWADMKRRCLKPNHKRYADYGGRGITVCERWLTFENFLADMGDRPTPQHSLDRENNDGHYCKENCRWATCQEQSQNRRARRDQKIYKDKSVNEWAEEWGVTYQRAYDKIRSEETAVARAFPPRMARAERQRHL